MGSSGGFERFWDGNAKVGIVLGLKWETNV